MLYDATGREIPEISQSQPAPGRHVIAAGNDREEYNVSRGLDPVMVDRIMTSANGGDTADQCRLAMELEENNWDIAHAVQTRRNAVLGIETTVVPASDSDQDKKIAEEFEAALKAAGKGNKLDSFFELRTDLMSALLPGFAASEVVWRQGGILAGFNFIDQHHFTFTDFTGEAGSKPVRATDPRLVTDDNFQGVALPEAKLIFHKLRRHGNDPARGGLVRPLAWLYCFSRINVGDLLRFVERHGMPFIVAKVDNDTWENERSVVQSIIRNFGPDGGGVFTRGVEFELLQASNNTGDVYFKLLEYIGQAITKVILGQTATAGDGGGWSNDSAQSQVRQDILEYDCRCIDSTINDQLIPNWVLFNYGPNVAAPSVLTDGTPPEDTVRKYEAIKARFDAVGVAIRAGTITPDEKIEESVREELELPEMSDKVKANWAKNAGVKRPITLKDPPKPPEPAQPPAEGGKKPNVTALSDSQTPVVRADSISAPWDTAAAAWLKPFQDIMDNSDESELPDFSALSEMFDTTELAELLEGTIYAGYASGIADRASTIKSKGGLQSAPTGEQ